MEDSLSEKRNQLEMEDSVRGEKSENGRFSVRRDKTIIREQECASGKEKKIII